MRRAHLALVIAGALFLAGCAREPDGTYTVRGQIVALPDPAKPGSDLEVKHEAIDTFVNAKGKMVGMGAMTMEFPTAEGVSLEGLAVGDIVELDFSVWWEPRVKWRTTAIRKLPAGTTLEFRAARPPAPPAPGAPDATGPASPAG